MPQARRALWRCSRCGRRFAKRRQWHSCRAQPIDRHFRGKQRRLVLGPKRVGHTVVLRSIGDIDRQLVGWLRHAYNLQTR